ncbi:HAD family hydrolase [Syntrophomonas erecta]
MFKAILFDLDGTLLNIDMDEFLKHYFRKMVEMAHQEGYPADGLVESVYQATDVMIADLEPETTNEEVFMKDFFMRWKYPKEEFAPFFDRYYQEVFPRLSHLCRTFPGVPEMMEKVFKLGVKVVIATNAVFPYSALKNRIDWAGVGHFDYDLITSYEVMHFCKPHVQYYEEISRLIGVDPEDCLMVGNDVGEDLPAGKIGMKTFLVEDILIDKGDNLTPDWRGKLPDLFRFIDSL